MILRTFKTGTGSLLLVAVCVSVWTTGVNADPVNPLRIQTRMQWPSHVDTIGEAARYVLAPTGYQLVTMPPAPREAVAITTRPISPQAIQFRTLPIDEALLAIAGPGIKLVVDTQNKLVSFGHIADREEP